MFIYSSPAMASPGKLSVYGQLISYNKKTVVIKTKNNSKLQVPRTTVFPEVQGVIVGKGQVSAKVTLKQLVALNPKFKELYKKIVKKEMIREKKRK